MNKKEKILLVDDEPDVHTFLRYNLENEGFSVLSASDGPEALELASEEKPDVVVLDVMMPGMNGIEVCKRLRATLLPESTIITFLSARNDATIEIAALEAGGDDYMMKPIEPKLFTARIHALLRQQRRQNHSNYLHQSYIILDEGKMVVIKDGQEIDLPKKEFKILKLLWSDPGKVFARSDILSGVWGKNPPDQKVISVHIKNIRSKVNQDFIKTIKGVGYRLDLVRFSKANP